MSLDTQQKVLRIAKFTVYTYGTLFDGWTDGTLWNGWATPLFEYDEAMRIVDAHNKAEPFDKDDPGRAWYDAEADRFCFVLAATDGEVEYYRAFERETQGQKRKLYAIGAWSWVWEEL
jgi:hypothetical protein